jgi:hypothetical protein
MYTLDYASLIAITTMYTLHRHYLHREMHTAIMVVWLIKKKSLITAAMHAHASRYRWQSEERKVQLLEVSFAVLPLVELL